MIIKDEQGMREHIALQEQTKRQLQAKKDFWSQDEWQKYVDSFGRDMDDEEQLLYDLLSGNKRSEES